MASTPKVELLAITDDAEELVCRCARNDYYDGSVFEDDFETVMEPVSGGSLEEKQENLLKKLMLRGHWGVYEHPQLTLWFRVSRACMAQITRHRHASFDIQSMRYVNFGGMDPEDEDDFSWPESFTADTVRAREGGQMEIEMPAGTRRKRVAAVYRQALETYNELVEAGVPKEDARMLLPVGTHVNVTMSMNVRSAFHVLNMRGAGDAQWEIRSLSEQIEELLAEHLPVSMGIWREKRTALQRQRLSP